MKQGSHIRSIPNREDLENTTKLVRRIVVNPNGEVDLNDIETGAILKIEPKIQTEQNWAYYNLYYFVGHPKFKIKKLMSSLKHITSYKNQFLFQIYVENERHDVAIFSTHLPQVLRQNQDL